MDYRFDSIISIINNHFKQLKRIAGNSHWIFSMKHLIESSFPFARTHPMHLIINPSSLAHEIEWIQYSNETFISSFSTSMKRLLKFEWQVFLSIELDHSNCQLLFIYHPKNYGKYEIVIFAHFIFSTEISTLLNNWLNSLVSNILPVDWS